MAYIITSKNAVISFISPLLGVPKILQGFSSENILVIPDVDIQKSTMGNDGQIAKSIVAKQVEGNFSFWAASPSLAFIYELQQAAYLSGFPIIGSLIVAMPSIATAFTYPDFSFASGPKGFELADELKPVTIKWTSQLPNKASLGAIATAAIGTLL